MQTKRNSKETGNVLICVLGAILILSLIGANVLRSSATRLNASCNQVRAWKEALSAAETGSDIAFAEIRKTRPGASPAPSVSPWTGWTKVGTTYTSPVTTFGSSNLQTQTVVEECYFATRPAPSPPLFTLGRPASGNSWYRLRSKGTAPLPNLKRTGMDDALLQDNTKHFAAFGSTGEMQDITARGKGDSLLRKIDFNIDHFVATYGPKGDGLNKALVPPTSPPSISRRIEQLVTPVTPFFDAAIQAAGTFYGLGSAGYIDSYNSNNGPYDPAVKNNPASPFYSDSRRGSVEIGSATATVKGSIYGDVATDGGTIVNGNPGIIYGTIDNNVPFSLEPYSLPGALQARSPVYLGAVGSNQDLRPAGSTTLDAPAYYEVSSLSGTLNVLPTLSGSPSPAPVQTYVAIRVRGDISGGNAGIVVNPNVNVRIYFEGNINTKSGNFANQSPSFSNPSSGPYAGNLQFYGISPTDGTTRAIDLNPGGPSLLYMTFYAPSAIITFNGNPDFTGTMVCKTFYANGNITWHYDRALNDDGELQDFRIASYVEDTR